MGNKSNTNNDELRRFHNKTKELANRKRMAEIQKLTIQNRNQKITKTMVQENNRKPKEMER